MWAAILAVLNAVPDIVKLFSFIADAIKAGEKELHVSIQLGKMDDAAQKAKDGKDTSAIEAIFRG